ncbi:MAG: metallophosphoesterase family protein [Clostridia bacterium]|nr:metallophosphoesterase family protein [Clostridia bacterium]
MKIGVISDTHDLLRPEVAENLKGCELILHAGDISSPAILDNLRNIAPVRAVRGNNDREWAEDLPLMLEFELGGLKVLMTHKKRDLPRDLTPYDLVIFGHSHTYYCEWEDTGNGKQTLLLNPGSCGPRRFYQPVTMAVLILDENGLAANKIDIGNVKEKTAPDSAPDLASIAEVVVRETARGRSPEEIARKHGIDPALAEKIARLYVTHPGVTVEGILRKMGV